MLDLDSDQYTFKRRYVVSRETIVILEGIFIFRKDLLKYLDLKIFLDVSFACSVKRALDRDQHLPAGQTEQRYAEKYHHGQRLYRDLEDPKRAADIIINNDDYLNPFEIL